MTHLARIRMLGKISAPSLLLLVLIVSLSLLPFASPAGASNLQSDNATAKAEGTNLHPVMVELFTSEGCSSCPPVDRMVEKWDKFQPIAGAQLIVLSEHVTYWDHDGWKDPNSLSSMTDRQSEYDQKFGQQPATPQLIVDGTQPLRPNDPHEIQDALQKAAATPMIPVRIADLNTSDPNMLQTRIEADANEEHNADVFVALALDHVESQVLKGENGGKHLTHVAVVQELTKVGKVIKGKSFDQEVQLKLKPGTDPKNLRVIAFVQESGPGRVLGAAMRKTSN